MTDYSNMIKFGWNEQTDSDRDKLYGVTKDGVTYTANSLASAYGKRYTFQAGSDIYLYVNFYTTAELGKVLEGFITARVALYGYKEPYKQGSAPWLLAYHQFGLAPNTSYQLGTILGSKFTMPDYNMTVFYAIQTISDMGWVSLIESPGFPIYSVAATPPVTTSNAVTKRCKLFVPAVGYVDMVCPTGAADGTCWFDSADLGTLIQIECPGTTTSSTTTTSSYVPSTGALTVNSLTVSNNKPNPGQKVTLNATIGSTYNVSKNARVRFYDSAGSGINKYAENVIPRKVL